MANNVRVWCVFYGLCEVDQLLGQLDLLLDGM